MIKRKIFAMILCLLMVLACGCGNEQTMEIVETEENISVVVEETKEAVTETVETVETTEDVVVEETSEIESEEEMITAVEEETETTEKVDFTVTEMSAIKYATQTVNVRSGASTDYEIIGSLSLNQEISVTGQASTGWFRIELDGVEGYVSNNYLADEQVEVVSNVEEGGGVTMPDKYGNVKQLPCRARVETEHGLDSDRETMMGSLGRIPAGSEVTVYEVFLWEEGMITAWVAKLDYNGTIGYALYATRFDKKLYGKEMYNCNFVLLD